MFSPRRFHTSQDTDTERKNLSTPNILTPKRKMTPVSGITPVNRRSEMYLRSRDASMASPSIASAYNTENYVIEVSASLPILVSETASSCGRDTDISAKFSENGWAWLICKRTLYVWKFKQVASKHLCKEFSLSSESSHSHADLACVGSTTSKDDGVVSVIVLTNTGGVRFWPNIIRSITSSSKTTIGGIDVDGGEELLRVLAVKGNSYIAATTTGALYHLCTMGVNISCTRLHNSQGVLTGIGRRVSSFFFASGSKVDLVDLVQLQSPADSSCDIVMLTATSLQRWQISSIHQTGAGDQLVSELDIGQLLNESVCQAIWNSSRSDLTMWPLDIKVHTKHKQLALLMACDDRTTSNTVLRLCICVCPLSIFGDGTSSGQDVRVFLLDHKEIMASETDCETFQYRLLIPNTTDRANHAIVWKRNRVIIKSLTNESGANEEYLQLKSGDCILGAGQFSDEAVLLEPSNGVLTVTPSQTMPMIFQKFEEKMNKMESPAAATQKLSGADQGAEKGSGSQDVNCLQSAFFHFSRHNTSHARSIIEESFTGSQGQKSLNDAVVFMSQQLIDDYPALDPRWAESLPRDGGNVSSSSLILQHQLNDKQKAHHLFLDFLGKVSIWNRLGVSTDPKSIRKSCAQWDLIEHGEKLFAASALREKHVEHQGIFDLAIRKVLDKRGNFPSKSGLTPQDVFFREISKIHDIFDCLLELEEDLLVGGSHSSIDMFKTVAGVNDIFQATLAAAYDFRNMRGILQLSQGIEFCPWTVHSGRHSMRETLLRQHEMIFSHGLPEADGNQQRALLHLHAATLADMILSDYKLQMESLCDIPTLSARYEEVSESFKRCRNAVLRPILDAGLLDKAVSLAEKYQDFGVLLEVCDRRDDQKLLSGYVAKFENLGFMDFLVSWFLERRKFRRLLEYTTSESTSSPDNRAKICDILSSHPRISWLHQIKSGDFTSASLTLRYLADVEVDSSAKKKHYTSLSKLAVAFSDEPEHSICHSIEDTNSQLAILKYQETLPNVVLEKLGLTLESMPVFPVERLIKLYIGEENSDSNEVDFMKALDLLDFLAKDSEKQMTDDDQDLNVDDFKYLIWCKAIMKDRWVDIEAGADALKSSGHTIFSKTLELASKAGALAQCLPDAKTLLEQPDLAALKKNDVSHYLIRMNLEHYQRQLAMA